MLLRQATWLQKPECRSTLLATAVWKCSTRNVTTSHCIAALAMLTLCTACAMAQYRVCVQDILYLVGPVHVQLQAWTAGRLHCRDSGSRAYE
jgi:hypothetical protein